MNSRSAGSRFVGELVKEKFAADDADERAMTGFSSRGPYIEALSREDGRAWPSRDERRLPVRRAGAVGEEEDGGWERHRIAEGGCYSFYAVLLTYSIKAVFLKNSL
jgi:hypothetical protein